MRLSRKNTDSGSLARDISDRSEIQSGILWVIFWARICFLFAVFQEPEGGEKAASNEMD